MEQRRQNRFIGHFKIQHFHNTVPSVSAAGLGGKRGKPLVAVSTSITTFFRLLISQYGFRVHGLSLAIGLFAHYSASVLFFILTWIFLFGQRSRNPVLKNTHVHVDEALVCYLAADADGNIISFVDVYAFFKLKGKQTFLT